MYYLMYFSTSRIENQEKAAQLKNQLMAIDGVKDVRFIGRNRVRLACDPAIVVPGRLTARLRALGLKTSGG